MPSEPLNQRALAGKFSDNSIENTVTRLHITPCTPELIQLILPVNIRKNTEDLSLTYHTIESFPERAYGFVTLSVNDAQRVKQRINNTYIAGMKVKVDEARESKRSRMKKRDAETMKAEAAEGVADGKKRKRSSTRLARTTNDEHNVLLGEQLEEGRKVKRGWVANGDRKLVSSSRTSQTSKIGRKLGKGGSNDAALVRTSVPENVQLGDGTKTKPKKTKGAKSGRIAEIKEFENTTKFPTFVHDDSKENQHNPASRFVEGKGWADDDGNIVENAPKGHTIDSDEDSQNDEEEDMTTSVPQINGQEGEDDLNTNSPITETANTSSIPPSNSPPRSTLESLFKRPSASASKSISPSKSNQHQSSAPKPSTEEFTFFSAESGGQPVPSTERPPLGKRKASSLSLLVPPSTPYHNMKERDRALRSAAPTPDTAVIGARAKFRVPWRSQSREWEEEDSQELKKRQESVNAVDAVDEEDSASDDKGSQDVDEDEIMEASEQFDAKNAQPQTEFEKEFYSQRGELNRAWKARRRAARKEKRQVASRRSDLGRGKR